MNFSKYRSIPTKLAGISDRTKGSEPCYNHLIAIISFWNRYDYKPDITDVWSDLDAFMLSGGGDCEDFAIAGYRLLSSFGWAPEKMWIVCGVNDNGVGHAVLSVELPSATYILDSADRTITRIDSYYSFRPIYAVNETAGLVFLPE